MNKNINLFICFSAAILFTQLVLYVSQFFAGMYGVIFTGIILLALLIILTKQGGKNGKEKRNKSSRD